MLLAEKRKHAPIIEIRGYNLRMKSVWKNIWLYDEHD